MLDSLLTFIEIEQFRTSHIENTETTTYQVLLELGLDKQLTDRKFSDLLVGLLP